MIHIPAGWRAGARYSCDGPEDCVPGSLCCFSPNAGAHCSVKSCPGIAIPMCHTGVDCPGFVRCCPYGMGPPPTPYSLCTNAPCPP